jgi:hypothetical protein
MTAAMGRKVVEVNIYNFILNEELVKKERII